MTRVAIYARVSTRDKDQNPDTQLVALRAHCQTQGWEKTAEYVDEASALDLAGRVQWKRLQADLQARRFDCVLVLRLDRAFRSVGDLHRTLDSWQPYGVKFVSLREGWDTETATGRLLMNFLASFAEFELALIRERINDGLARAKLQGKRLGRPPGSSDKHKRRNSGYIIREQMKRRARGE